MKNIFIGFTILTIAVSLINAETSQNSSSNKDKAFFMKYQQSAEQNSPEGIYNLGVFYMEGKGVKKNMKMAYNLFLKSANMRYARAQYNIGVLYYKGIIVKQNYSTSIMWFMMAMRENLPEALYAIGLLYEEGKVIEKDLKKALGYYVRAADLGNSSAIEKSKKEPLLKKDIDLRIKGTDTEKKGDYQSAIKYFKKSIPFRVKVLGQEEPAIATTYNKIGSLHQTMGDYPKALGYYKKSLLIREKVLGKAHKDTRQSYDSIGTLYLKMGDHNKGIEYYQINTDIMKERIADDHYKTKKDRMKKRIADLKLPKLLHSGELGNDIFAHKGLDTIEAISIDTEPSLLGYSSFKEKEDQKVLNAWEVFPQLDTGGHAGDILDIIATKSGDIITASKDKTIRIWDSKTGKEKRKILGYLGAGPLGKVYAIALSPDEEQLAVAGYLKLYRNSHNRMYIRIYHYTTGVLIKAIAAHRSTVLDLAYSPDSKYLISGSGDKTAKIWDVSKNFSLIDTITHHTNSVYAVKIVKQADRYLAITAGLDNQISLYDIQKRKIVKSRKTKHMLLFLATASNLFNGRIAVCGKGKEILIYDFNLKLIKKVKSETKPIGLAYSNDGKFLIAGTGKKPWNVNIYQSKNNYRKKTNFKKHTNATRAVTFLGNHTAISAGGTNNEIYLWDIQRAKVKRKISGVGKSVFSVGIKGDTIGWGNKWTGDSHTAESKLQKTINLKKFEIDKQNKKLRNLKRISTKKGAYSLTHTSGGDYGQNDATLIIMKNKKESARITKDGGNGYRHNCYGFYKNYIISGDAGGFLTIYNLKGKEIASLIGHTGQVWSIAVDGDRLVSGSDDQTIKIWDLRKVGVQEDIYPMLNLFISKTNDYIVWTNEGYFTASEDGMQYLYFHLNLDANNEAKVIPMKKLYDNFFRPDLIQLKLSGDEEAYKKATQDLDFKSALQNPPPTVSFNQTDKITDKEKITLSFNIQDEDGGIGLIRVYQEGKLIQTIGDGKVNKQSANMNTLLEQERLDKDVKVKQKTYIASLSKSIEGNLTIAETIAPVQPSTTTNEAGTYTIDLDLIAGDNKISIEAFNKTNTVTSYRETITINAGIPIRQPKLYAIVAGVNEFEAPNVHNLKYSKNDAKDIKEITEQQMNKLYKNVEVTYLEGQDLTKANILKAAQEIAKKAKLEDTIVFYISTHGRAVGGKLYLVPYNNKNVKNWIDFEQIFKSIQSIKALNQVFVIDTCESGKANDIVSSVYDSRASVLAKSSGVHMLLATTKGTFAFEHTDPTIHNGVFTYKILQALRNKTTDTNKDKTISILELSKKLKEPTNNADYQYPVIRNVGSDVGLVNVD